MALSAQPIATISYNDLKGLVEQAQREGVTLEFKRDLYEWNDSSTREFLADVSSFANSQGGLLLIGVDEVDGCASAIPGIEGDIDTEIQRISSKIQTGVEPRLSNVDVGAIGVSDGRTVIAIRVPRSWSRPHMVTFKNYSRFFARNSSGKYQLDVQELRNLILGAEAIPERVRKFRFGRVGDIESGATPVVLETGAKLVLHVVPFAALEPGTAVELPDLNDINSLMRPIMSAGWSWRHNFDGLLTFTNENHSEIGTYVQLFRSGMAEAVDCRLLRERDDGPYIPSIKFEEEVIQGVSRFRSLVDYLGLAPPLVWMLTLIGVRGYYMVAGSSSRHRIDRHVIAVPEVIDETGELSHVMVAKRLVDPVWQACGWERSINFDAEGSWTPRR